PACVTLSLHDALPIYTLPDFESGSAGSGGASGASTNPFGDGSGIGVFEDDLRAGQAGLLDDLIVYFEYDRADVPAQYNDMLSAQDRKSTRLNSSHVKI